jgi:hypothetical protein
MNAAAASMNLVGVVSEVHQLVDRVVAEQRDNDQLQEAWSIASNRLDSLVAELVGAHLNDDWEDVLTEQGMIGPEFELLCRSLRKSLGVNDSVALEIAALFLDAISPLPGPGIYARPVATFVRVLRAVTLHA